MPLRELKVLRDWSLRSRIGLQALVLLGLPLPHGLAISRGPVLCVALAAAAYFALRQRSHAPRSDTGDLVVSLLATTLVVHWSGGLASPFFGLYYVDVVLAAASHGLRGSLLVATGAGIGALVAELAQKTWLISADDAISSLPYLYIIALVTGNLVGLLQQETGRRVSEQEARTRSEERESRHEEDLRYAGEVQRALLPRSLPCAPEYQIAVRFLPEREVGGDFYHVDLQASGELDLAVGDVRGHGLSAALLLAGLKRSISHTRHLLVPEMLSRINQELCPDTPDDMFITLFYGRLSLKTGMLTYGSAGHVPFLLVRSQTGEVAEGQTTGLPLGLLPDSQYEELRIQMNPGDVLACYTDGIVERRLHIGDVDDHGESKAAAKVLNWEHLVEALRESRMEPAERICDRLLESAGLPGDQEDDATLLVVRWLGPGRAGTPEAGSSE